MKAFAVSVNGKRLWTAGIGPNGVFNVIVGCCVGGPRHAAEGDFHFHIGGLDGRTDEHVKWKTPHIGIGDSVTVEIVEVEEIDRETTRFRVYDTPDGKKPKVKLITRPKSTTKKPMLRRKR